MNALNKIETEKPSGLALMRAPFPENCISKLPKPTKKQTDEVRADFKKGVRCQICGGWHHPQVVHLDYVGHAALTDRLLACDPEWNWEPANGDPVPTLDEHGGMWIKLTVCGVTRLGYGHSDGKRGGDAIKETIGDALRNAAMRFGAALDLWHKGQLHDDGETQNDDAEKSRREAEQKKADQFVEYRTGAIARLTQAPSLEALQTVWQSLPHDMKADATVISAKDDMKASLSKPLVDDEIPY